MKRTVPKTTLVLVILLASLLPTPTKASTEGDISLASVSTVWNTLIDQISDVLLPIFYTNPQIVINPVSHPLSVGTLNPQPSTTTQTIIRNITNVQTLSQSDLDQITNTLRQQLQNDANTYASNAAGHAVDSLGRNQVVNGNIATGGNGTFTGTIEATDLSSSHGLVLPSYTPLDTTNLLYNTDDSLYWRGSVIAGSAVGTWSQSNGNVYRTTGNVGIGTNDPSGSF